MEPRRDIDLAAELDERAAAGFPRRSSSAASPLGRLVVRLRTVEPRHMLLPAGATAFAGIVVATALVATTSERANNPSFSFTPPEPARLDSSRPAAPSPTQSSVGHAEGARRAGETGDRSELELSESAPKRSAAEAPTASAAQGRAVAPPALESSGPGPYASHVSHRDVERSAQIALATNASGVRSAAAKVFEAVHAYRGIVLSSSILDGAAGEAGATFDLLIPSGRFDDAMAAFSAIAEVRSRSESTADVTAPIIGLGERLQDARAKVESLLAQLAGAETEAEQTAAEAKLRSARHHVAALRGRLTALQRRTHLSSVSLRIETGGDAGRGGGWGVGNALGDAGNILSVAAGVSLVGLAILAPLALLCLLAWLARRTWISKRREHALG